MLELLIVVMWTAFVCSYLIWQQVTGDVSLNRSVSVLGRTGARRYHDRQ